VSPAPTTAAQRTKRLHLLDAAEIAALYDRPRFTDEERAYYFALTPYRNCAHADLHRRSRSSLLRAATWVFQGQTVRKLNTALIIEQWNELQRIFVSLARKTTTQSVLISKLSSAKRRNQVLQALWEYDHIYGSAYLLEFIDSPKLRQSVQRALNRGEQYHQMKRALTQANAGKLRYATDEEQELWNECSRLLINAILYYNMIMLSEAVRRREQRGDIIGAEQLKAVSPVARIHVNFYGRYSFSEEPLDVPIYGFVETMAKCSFRTEISTSEETIDRSVTVKRTSVRYKFSGRAGLNPISTRPPGTL
jgi:hypothetical protein